MDIYDDDFDYTDYTDEDDYDNDDFDFHHGNVDDLYDDVGDDYDYDAWGINDDGGPAIPADLVGFYPEQKTCVKSFMELYVLCGKMLKMIKLIDEHYVYVLQLCKFVLNVKTVQDKCRVKIRSALGKVVPLPTVVVDKLLHHILGGESLGDEDFKFEDISAEDIGPVNLMYGKISSVYQYLRKCSNEDMVEVDEIDLNEEDLIRVPLQPTGRNSSSSPYSFIRFTSKLRANVSSWPQLWLPDVLSLSSRNLDSKYF